MAVIETWFEQDLQKAVQVQHLDGSLFSNNANGNRIGVVVYNNGVAASLSGTVSGYAVLPDGTTVPCTGSLSGNRASVLIPAAAYQPGIIFVSVFLTSGSTVTTLAAVAANVQQARTDSQVSPGSAVTDWTQTINAAMQSVVTANAANMAVEYGSLTYPVPVGKYTIYNDLLYRCTTPIATAESWTASHWTRVRIADDVSYLKSALNHYIPSDSTEVELDFVSNRVSLPGIPALAGVVYHFVLSNYTGDYVIVSVKEDQTKYNSILNDGELVFTPTVNGEFQFFDHGNVRTNATIKVLGNDIGTYRRELTTGEDLNDLIQPGTYFADKATVNSLLNPPPYKESPIVMIVGKLFNKNAVFQFVVPYLHDSLIYRVKSNRGWNIWKETNSEFKIKTVSVDFSSNRVANTGVVVPKNGTAIIRKTTAFEGKINIFGHGDSDYYTWLYDGMNTAVYNCYGTDRYIELFDADNIGGSVTVDIYVLMAEKIEKTEHKTYRVGAKNRNCEYQSFTQCLLDLKDDDRPKTIIVDGGEYDIFQEYRDANVPRRDPNDAYENRHDYMPYVVIVPPNTHIIGQGRVVLKYMPDASDTYKNESDVVSVLNVSGSATIENIEIHGKNCRYCIHDETLGMDRYSESRKIYKNVKCIMEMPDNDVTDGRSLGFKHTIGFGFDDRFYFEFDDCTFINNAEARAFYMHNRTRSNRGYAYNVDNSSTIIVNRCIMKSNSNLDAALVNSNGATQRIISKFTSCYFHNKKITAADDSGGVAGTYPNAYQIVLLGCNTTEVGIPDESNLYPPEIYNLFE